jgi:hypothetical protein
MGLETTPRGETGFDFDLDQYIEGGYSYMEARDEYNPFAPDFYGMFGLEGDGIDGTGDGGDDGISADGSGNGDDNSGHFEGTQWVGPDVSITAQKPTSPVSGFLEIPGLVQISYAPILVNGYSSGGGSGNTGETQSTGKKAEQNTSNILSTIGLAADVQSATLTTIKVVTKSVGTIAEAADGFSIVGIGLAAGQAIGNIANGDGTWEDYGTLAVAAAGTAAMFTGVGEVIEVGVGLVSVGWDVYTMINDNK